MKIILAFVALFALVCVSMADDYPPPLCGCPPAQEICASNHQTYNGICDMGCDHKNPNLKKLHDGPCVPGEA